MKKYRELIESYFKIDISNKTRKFNYVFARACYYYLCREFGNNTLLQIANSLDKNHATVLYSLNQLPYMIKFNNECKEQYNEILHKLNLSNYNYSNKSLKEIVVSYNVLLIENDLLKAKVLDLEQTIIRLAEIE